MKVRDIMSRQIVSVAPEESASVAARLLARHNVGALPVCGKDGRLRGLLTDRDIVLRCIAADEDPTQMKVAELMTRRLICADAEQSVQAAGALMAREQVRRLPVEENGRLVGMLSLGDLAKLPRFTTEAAAALCEISENLRIR